MIKKISIALLLLNTLASFGQEAWLDSIAIYSKANAQLDSIKKWELQVETARQKKNIDEEMLGLYKILDAKVFDFGNLQRYDEYEEVALLEALIEQYPNNKVTLKIRAALYDMLGTHFANQRFAKNVIEGFQDRDLAVKAITYFEKAEKLAKEDKNWYVYYRAKIFLDSNLKGLSAEEVIEQFLPLEDEIKQNNAYDVLPRYYAMMSQQYLRIRDYEKSLEYAKNGISKNLRKRRLNQLVSNLSLYYLIIGQPLEALKHGKSSLHLSMAYDTGAKRNSNAHVVGAYVLLDSLQKASYYRKNYDKLIAEHNTIEFTKYQSQLQRAIATNDVVGELKSRLALAQHKMFFIGNAELAYLDLLALEERLNEYPQFKEAPETIAFYALMGFNLNYQEKYEESEAYLNQGFELAKKHKAKFNDGYFQIAFRLIELYGRLGDKYKTEVFYQQIEKELMADTTSFKRLSSILYQHAGLAFQDLEDYETAIPLLNKCIDINPSNGQAYAMQAANYNAIGQNDSVIYYGERALFLPNREFVAPWLAHKALGETYRRTGAFEKALYHLSEYERINTNLRSGDSAFRIGIIDKEREQEKAALQAALSNQKLASQRRILWGVSVGALFFALGLFYIFNRLKLIRKQNVIIAKEKQRAEQSERYKEQFLANMSHEIRTPMHAISGMLNTLRRKKHPASQNPYLDAMKISSDNLLVLLNDVLDLSKIESGNLDIEQREINVKEIIQNVVQLFKYKAEEKGILLQTTIPECFPDYVMGDAGRLQQILVNLVGNALKFTERGSVTIALLEEKGQLQFEIKDTGIGMEKEQLKAIFEPFKQGSNISKGRHGGTGLGLAISKQLVELQQGRIWAESIKGKGSSFFFQLPLLKAKGSQATSAAISEAQLKEIGKRLKGYSILIAEDNAFNVMVVQDDLEWYIPEVKLTIAHDGKEAMKKYENNSYDLILMDVQMPEMNGYEATKAIRHLEVLNQTEKPIPIIAMTASLLKAQISKCFDAGMNGYIPKPYKPEELINTLIDVLTSNSLKIHSS